MDLALELGMTVQALKSNMTEREFVMWQHYSRKRFLPTRRIEHYLAQIAQRVAGGDLADYLLRPPEEIKAADIVAAVQTISPTAGMRRLGQGRKGAK